MATSAQEEADRLFNQHERYQSHPEDRRRSLDSHSDSDSDREGDARNQTSEPAFPSSSGNYNQDDEDTDEEDVSNRMSSLTTTSKMTYKLPTNPSYANTGPKGVIADAQDFARAKSSLRKTLAGFGDKFSRKKSPSAVVTIHEKQGKESSRDQDSADELEDHSHDDDDDGFMNQWRQNRLVELQQKQQQQQRQQQQQQSRRTYGVVIPVEAEGYLDAIEHSPAGTTVVVFLHDPDSPQSCAVEDDLDMLAYKRQHVRFIKLHYEIADVDTNVLKVPAVVAYRAGDVVGTIGGIIPSTSSSPSREDDALEKELIRQGVLTRHV